MQVLILVVLSISWDLTKPPTTTAYPPLIHQHTHISAPWELPFVGFNNPFGLFQPGQLPQPMRFNTTS